MDFGTLRAQFPALSATVVRDGKRLPLSYLDSAATALKPRAVIDAVTDYYTNSGVSVHRGVYELSQQTTDRFEAVRDKVAAHFNLDRRYAVVFTRGTTESLNIVARGWAQHRLGIGHAGSSGNADSGSGDAGSSGDHTDGGSGDAGGGGSSGDHTGGDEILITEMEHHANIVPWQQACRASGCALRHVAVDSQRQIVNADNIDRWFSPRTKLLAITGMSNVTGWRPPLARIIAAAHRRGIIVVVDGAQLAAHARLDLAALDCDFFTCSAHKMFGPTGLGVLIGKRELLDQTEAFVGGGNMITEVRMESSVFKAPPEKFEAGTPHVAGVIGFGAALDMLARIDFAEIADRERALTAEAYRRLSEMPEVEIYGAPLDPDYSTVIAFNVRGAHAHDVGSILDQEGVALRAGHHCAQPYHRALGAESSVRASFHLYNTPADVAALVRGVRRAVKIFR